jgi:hypothetical protein
MEAALAKLLEMLAKHGPGFLVAAIFIALYVMERRDSRKELEGLREGHHKEIELERGITKDLTIKLFELSSESIKADTEHTETIKSMTKVLDSIDRRLT